MFKTSFDRSPLVITARLVLLLIVLVPLLYGVYMLHELQLGDRTPVLPTPPGARMEPRPTPHELMLGKIPAFEGKVTSLAFYKAIPDDENYEWGLRFLREPDHFIYNIIYFEFPPATKDYTFQLNYIFYKNGQEFRTGDYVTMVEKGSTSHNVYYGWDFPPGLYYVEILYEGTVIANGGYEVYE